VSFDHRDIENRRLRLQHSIDAAPIRGGRMASLLDLDRSLRKATVVVNDVPMEVVGLTPDDFAYLALTFDGLRKMMENGEGWDRVALLGDVVAEMIACGFSARGDKEIIEIAKTLSLGKQIELAQAIHDLSFEEGFGPFVERLKKMGLLVDPKTTASPSAKASMRSSSDGPNELLDFGKATMVQPAPAMVQ
jgi:hypothetical protein